MKNSQHFPQWEYRVVSGLATDKDFEDLLNEYGALRWELVSVIQEGFEDRRGSATSPTMRAAYLKRIIL